MPPHLQASIASTSLVVPVDDSSCLLTSLLWLLARPLTHAGRNRMTSRGKHEKAIIVMLR